MKATELTRGATLASWACQLTAAAILGQTLFFKFTGAPESRYIFSTLGIEPWGRIGTGVAELVAVALLLYPKTSVLGAVLAVAGSGVLDDPRGGLRGEAPDFPPIYAPITREHLGTWEALRTSQLDWTLVCCPDLQDGELTRRYRVSGDVLPEGGTSISVEDTAALMLQQLNLTPYVRRRVGIAY